MNEYLLELLEREKNNGNEVELFLKSDYGKEGKISYVDKGRGVIVLSGVSFDYTNKEKEQQLQYILLDQVVGFSKTEKIDK